MIERHPTGMDCTVHIVIWFQHCGAIFYIKSMSVSVDRKTERKKEENKKFL